jgi:DNA-binding transcriptional LysR family regulator
MTLEQLRVFVAVAEREHVTRAAEALNLAQSAASAAIAALEARHGCKLFDRIGRGIVLTEAGALFLIEARAVLARAEAAELALAELAGLKRGVLRVQASQTIASYWLPRHLVAFRRAHPGIDIRLGIGNTAQVAATVRQGAAELGFVEGAVADPALASIPLAHDRIVLVVGPEHPWAGRGDLRPDELPESVWVLREPGSGTRSSFEDGVAALGVAPDRLRTALELPSNEAVRAAVESGLGATALSASVVAPSLEAGLLCHVPLALPERRFHALRNAERQPSRAALTLLGLIAGGD